MLRLALQSELTTEQSILIGNGYSDHRKSYYGDFSLASFQKIFSENKKAQNTKHDQHQKNNNLHKQKQIIANKNNS